MITSILDTIATNLKTSNKFFTDGFTAARLIEVEDRDGNTMTKVLTGENKDKKYVGITDSRGSFFYIRFTDEDATFEESDNKYSSCDNYLKASVPLKLVAVSKGHNNFGLEEKLRSDLITMDIPSTESESEICIRVKSSNMSASKVYESETNKQFDGRHDINIIEINFDLDFNFQKDKCITDGELLC